jgi:hypothetical protein
LSLSDHFVFYFEFPEELMHLCCAGWFLDEGKHLLILTHWSLVFVKNQLGVKLNLTDIGRSHPIGEIRAGKISIIVRFLTYRQRHMVFSKKKELKGHVDKTFISENLTRHRYDLLKRLNTLRVDRKIHSLWTHDGSVLVKGKIFYLQQKTKYIKSMVYVANPLHHH